MIQVYTELDSYKAKISSYIKLIIVITMPFWTISLRFNHLRALHWCPVGRLGEVNVLTKGCLPISQTQIFPDCSRFSKPYLIKFQVSDLWQTYHCQMYYRLFIKLFSNTLCNHYKCIYITSTGKLYYLFNKEHSTRNMRPNILGPQL